jgi:ABC-type nitrate/sulfonate/bicarbonate transport system substrate-binding protein
MFSACSAAATPAPSGAGDKTIFFGSGAVPGSPEDYLLPLYTTARASLKSQGYALEYTALSTDEVVEAALDRGRIDVALLSMVGLQRAAKAGLKMKWILTNETQNTFVLVVKKDVTDLKQLKGKKIGSQDATSLSTAAIPGILGPAGLAASDYSVVYLAGSGARAAALTAGSMDASMMLYTIAAQLITKSSGAFKIWGGGAAAAPAAMWEGFVASDGFRANKPAATAFVKAMLGAWTAFYAGDAAKMAKDAIALELNELMGLEEESAVADLKLYQSMKLFPTDGGLGEDLYTRMLDTLVAVDQLKKADTLAYKDVVDTSFLDAAKK